MSEGFSGPSIPRPIAASFPLSDLRCFRVLSSASVLDSDYSASALPFPHLPVSASQWLPQCSVSAFASSVFPVLSRLVSRAFLPSSGTQLRCSFPFALPRFTPTAVPRVLTFRFHFRSFPLPIHFLSSASVLLLATQLSALSFPFFPASPDGGFSGASVPLALLGFPHPSRLFPCAPSGFGTQLPAIPFSLRLFRVTGTTQLLASCFQLGHSPWLSL